MAAVLVHVLTTWSRRPAEGDIADIPRYCVWIEIGKPSSCGSYFLIFSGASVCPCRV